ncbi:MAG: WD40/YVTN/BNR-like repeat-containing protein, partial [Candidatus Poribacteria bacterium]
FLDVYFLDSKKGWAVGFGPIASTDDGGKTWKCQPNETGTVLWGIYFDSKNRGWAVGANGVIIYTNDGGKSWKSQSSGTNSWIFDICKSGDKLWAVGLKGSILKFAQPERS